MTTSQHPSAVRLRAELHAVGISITDLRALLDYYDVKDEKQTAELIDLARTGRTQRG